jgi:uncharacterized membrane protein YhaH (DUF805 family)
MTEQTLGSRPARRQAFPGFFKGRGNRKEYWAAMGAMFGLGFILGLVGGNFGASMAGPSLFFMIRRLHDTGKSGWWALAITFGPFVPMIALLPFAPMTVLLPMVVLLSVVWTIWLGAIPGDPHENRWGPPPGRPDLQEVFS